MKTVFRISLLLALLSLLLASCDKESGEPIDMGYNYFPVEQHSYSIYQVDSTVWDNFNNVVIKYNYQVKMLVDSSFEDSSGRTNFYWKKYVKTDSTSWNFANNYAITKTIDRLEILQENERFIKLIFPVTVGEEWNSNAMNTQQSTEAQYTEVDYETQILNQDYDSCAMVTYEEEVNLIQEFIHQEIYARNRGMIYKKQTHKLSQTTGIQGYSVEYKLMSYGKE